MNWLCCWFRRGARVMGLLVDGFKETLGVIQKPMAGVLSGLSTYSGSALMGDGSVLMILNMPGDRLMPIEFKKNRAFILPMMSQRRGSRRTARMVAEEPAPKVGSLCLQPSAYRQPAGA
jgi:hypothetical protein